MHAWRNWLSGNALDITDPCLKSESRIEMTRCIHIELSCVQENLDKRPTMVVVLLMLNNGFICLSRPSKPAFYINGVYSQISRQSIAYNSIVHDPNDVYSISELDPR